MTASGGSDLVDRFQTFYSRYYDDRDGGRNRIVELAQAYPKEQKSLVIDYDDLYRFDRELADDWIADPDQLREYAEDALARYDLPADLNLCGANVRLGGLDDVVEPYCIDVGDYVVDSDAPHADVDELRVIQGQVSKVAQAKGRFTEITFECQRCGTMTHIPQIDDSVQEPHECQGCERQGPFRVNQSQSASEDYQLIRVQRPPEQSRGGQQPDTIDITLTDDLTNTVSPGDRVDVAAHLERDINDDDGTFEIAGAAQNVEHRDTDFEDVAYAEYTSEIEAIAANNPHQQIVDSIMPTHMGDAHIKEAIALQMFGGVEKELADGSRKRGQSHLLLVGDPGTDKSGLLEYATTLAPRSVYTSGKNASSAGLTCAATQTDFGDGGWTLEAGALVEAHRGLCAIDEFDKMPEEEREGVHEALANGTISPSKAGITNVTLPAKTTVIAAANPKYGRFDPYEPVGEQLEIGPTLISRFDLIFTLEDTPDTDRDSRLADHLNEHARLGSLATAGRDHEIDADSDVAPAIDEDVMRAYVAYAKETIQPVLSDAAGERIKEFYLDIRSKGVDEDTPVPITPRKIEALHRLSEAAARIRLSESVEPRDVDLAIELLNRSLQDVGIDPESGEFDADVVETGTSKTQRDRIKTVKTIISEIELEHAEGAPLEEVIDTLTDEYDIPTTKIDAEIEKLREKGEIYEPTQGHLRVS